MLLYKRQKYETWVLVFTVLLGAESLSRSMPLLLAWKVQQTEDPYGEIGQTEDPYGELGIAAALMALNHLMWLMLLQRLMWGDLQST